MGYKGLRFKHGDGIDDERGIVEGVEDKVTQDVDKSEVSGRGVDPIRHSESLGGRRSPLILTV
jgi:hypothetical protein